MRRRKEVVGPFTICPPKWDDQHATFLYIILKKLHESPNWKSSTYLAHMDHLNVAKVWLPTTLLHFKGIAKPWAITGVFGNNVTWVFGFHNITQLTSCFLCFHILGKHNRPLIPRFFIYGEQSGCVMCSSRQTTVNKEFVVKCGLFPIIYTILSN